LNYLKGIGCGNVNSSWRTAEQTEIAHFWAEGAPAGWNRIANTVIRERNLDPWKAARILALVNFAIADSFIASFDAKYQFRFWRPSRNSSGRRGRKSADRARSRLATAVLGTTLFSLD
jgi:hypothetical protein